MKINLNWFSQLGASNLSTNFVDLDIIMDYWKTLKCRGETSFIL